jgi:hypothetical protein
MLLGILRLVRQFLMLLSVHVLRVVTLLMLLGILVWVRLLLSLGVKLVVLLVELRMLFVRTHLARDSE